MGCEEVGEDRETYGVDTDRGCRQRGDYVFGLSPEQELELNRRVIATRVERQSRTWEHSPDRRQSTIG